MSAQVIINPEGLVAQGRHDGVMLQLEASEWTGHRALTYGRNEWRFLDVEFDVASAIRLQEGSRQFVRVLLSRRMLPPLVVS
jgi:hypothetical protein